MKIQSNFKHQQNLRRKVGIVVALAVASLPQAFAHGPEPGIFTPDESVLGMTYGDWSAAWWQYVLSVPANTNPVNDTSGANCGVEQSTSPVFFLVGAATPVTRTCTVPASKPIFFPIINVECSTVEADPFFGANGQALRNCVGKFPVDVDTLEVKIDRKKIKDLGRYRAQSPVFDFSMPAADNYLGLPGITSGSSVSDGYWLMLKPLSPGHHVIHFEGAFDPSIGFSQDITYNLTVVP